MTEAERKKPGRKPMPEAETKRQYLTLRFRGGLRERLKAASDASGRSMSEEVERAVEHYFEGRDSHSELSEFVNAAVRAVERKLGKPWHDPSMRAAIYGAVDTALFILLDERPEVLDLRRKVDLELMKAPENKLTGPADLERVRAWMDEIRAWQAGSELGLAVTGKRLESVRSDGPVAESDPKSAEAKYLKEGP